MRKALLVFSVVTLALVVTSCDLLSGDDSSDTLQSPDMGSPTELPATGATSYPVGETESLALYMDAVEALSALMVFGDSMSSQARATETVPLDYSASVGGGTVDFTGSMTMTTNGPDYAFEPTANTTYNDLMRYLVDMNLEGTIDNITDSGFNITAAILFDVYMDVSMDLKTGSDIEEFSDATTDFDVAFAQSYGMAISVRDTVTAVGAKFILSYALEYDQSNIAASLEGEEAMFEPILEELENKTVSLKVYNDANELIGEYAISAMDLGGLDMLPF